MSLRDLVDRVLRKARGEDEPPKVLQIPLEPVSEVKPKRVTRPAYGLLPGYRWNPFTGWPPNAPCFCGEPRKFKKCHAGKIAPVCKEQDYPKLQKIVNLVKAGHKVNIKFTENKPKLGDTFATQATPAEVT